MEFLQIWLKSKILTNNMKILFAVRSLNIGGTERQIISMSNMLINYGHDVDIARIYTCLLYTSPSPRDRTRSRMPSSA